MRTRAAGVVGMLLAGLGAAVALAAPAWAAAEGSDEEDSITAYHLDVVLDEVGTAEVTLNLEVDFGERPNHGPFLTYLVKQKHDETQDRVYRITDVRASSPSADASVEVEEDGRVLAIRIGDEDRTYRGVHRYTVTYQVEGWITSAAHFPELEDDELILNVINDWDIDVHDVLVTVTGPGEVLAAECFDLTAGTACSSAEHDGGTARFTQERVGARGDLRVVAAYPAGTFGDVEPRLQDRWAFGRAFAATPLTAGAAALLLAGGVGALAHRARTRGRDQQYLGLTPGLVPADGAEGTVGHRGRAPVAVQFTPPAGFRPGQLGTLIDERADQHDVTATLVDLAVRGYLRIEQTGPPDPEGKGKDKDWRLTRTLRPTGDLLPYEASLYSDLFDGREQVELSDLRTTFAASMSKVQDALYDDVTERGWFRANPKAVRSAWIGTGVLVVILGVLLTVALAIWTSWALLGLAVVVLGVVTISLAGAAPARTAAGTAVLHQLQGFRTYIAHAEAEEIRFSEGEDLFSRYLPFAIVFGLAERWARVFADLAAQGRGVPEPSWYVGGYTHGALWASGGFTSDLTSFTTMAESSLSAPAPSSSGTGGGGFSGGGVSGGGGGTW